MSRKFQVDPLILNTAALYELCNKAIWPVATFKYIENKAHLHNQALFLMNIKMTPVQLGYANFGNIWFRQSSTLCRDVGYGSAILY